ncbi:hypothetical protein Tco_1556243 [Tanacetum coccineum]
MFNEWILDSFDIEEEYAKEIRNPYSGRFDEYKQVFNNEVEHLSNEYNLRIGKKGYVLDDVWEKCEQYHRIIIDPWHDESFKEDELWRSGDEKTDYEPPYVDIKTFEFVLVITEDNELAQDGDFSIRLFHFICSEAMLKGVSSPNSTLFYLLHFLNVQ